MFAASLLRAFSFVFTEFSVRPGFFPCAVTARGPSHIAGFAVLSDPHTVYTGFLGPQLQRGAEVPGGVAFSNQRRIRPAG